MQFSVRAAVADVGDKSAGHRRREDRLAGRHSLRRGRAGAALGVAGLAAATVTLVDPLSAVAALSVFALIGFHLLAGWKTYRLSTTA